MQAWNAVKAWKVLVVVNVATCEETGLEPVGGLVGLRPEPEGRGLGGVRRDLRGKKPKCDKEEERRRGEMAPGQGVCRVRGLWAEEVGIPGGLEEGVLREGLERVKGKLSGL